ncbi:MAG: hypothetical protein HY583_02235, partial [Candidatus Omnitrophica bacterium]|nr:hypothetical protein [Candidatus Omnitrophota bacterium]
MVPVWGGKSKLGKYLRSKVLTSLLFFLFIFGPGVYPQQASVSDPVSNVGQNVGPVSRSVNQVDRSAALVQPDLNPYNIIVPEEFG